jgi:hypothetical protein
MKDICPLRIQRADFLYRCVTEWRPGTEKKRREKSQDEKGMVHMEQRAELRKQRVVSAGSGEGLSISDVILVGVLLAAGAVLKFFVGSLFSVGMKPNFIIAMYCLSILIIRPKFKEAAVIGLLAGAICQFFPGTPYLNFVSELVGAVVMAAFMRIPSGKGRFSLMPVISTFISTLASGFTFIAAMYLIFYAGANVKPVPLAIFLGIIFGTAAINSVIVQILYVPLKLALKKGQDQQ